MTANAIPDFQLPRLRPDLEFFEGPEEIDGAPTVNIHDPLTGVFHKIGWAEAEILRRLQKKQTLLGLLRELALETTVRVSPAEIFEFCKSAAQEQLTSSGYVRDVESLQEEYDARSMGPLKWLLIHYLYIRIPLLRPDGFLSATLPMVRWLASPVAFVLYFIVAAIGLANLLLRFSEYSGKFTYFFNFEGLVYYGLAIVGVKVIHEFSHAYVAKSKGVRVPTMGIAFMVLCPLAFCDVTDGWRLKRRVDRFAISFAGISAELVLAGLALFMWSVVSSEPMNSIFFIISSVTIVSTLLVNLNPAMRFDGYYILSDLWGIDNMRERAFAMARWAMRRFLLGMDIAPPEESVGRRRLAGMIFYSSYAVVYRIGLFLGIAVLVYYKFTKILGAFLALFEIMYFIVLPALREVSAIVKLRDKIRFKLRFILTVILLGGLALWFVLPLPRRVGAAAVVVPGEGCEQLLYAPDSGKIVYLNGKLKSGIPLKKGEMLMVVENENIGLEVQRLQADKSLLEKELLRASTGTADRAEIPRKREEIKRISARIVGLREKERNNTVSVRIDGILEYWDGFLVEGGYVRKDVVIGKVTNFSRNRVFAYVKQEDLNGIGEGGRLVFTTSGGGKVMSKVAVISKSREVYLPYAQLAGIYGGDLPVAKTSNGELMIVGTYYRIVLELDDPFELPESGRSGRVWLKTEPRSLAGLVLRNAWSVLVKESGF